MRREMYVLLQFAMHKEKSLCSNFMHHILYLEEMRCCRELNGNKRKTVFSSRKVDLCISAGVMNMNNRTGIFSNCYFLETCR